MLLKGWASKPNLDLYRHIVAAGAFTDSIRRKGLSGPKAVKLLVGHENYKPAGAITTLEQRQQGLWIEADLNEKISYARDMAEAIRSNKGFSFSVGFYVLDADVAKDRRGEEYLLITKGELLEVSIVIEPANPEAVMTELEEDQ